MTVEEAVQLVVQAGAIGRTGEVLVLDMGNPVRINELAEQLANDAHQDVEIVFTGLRPGEKIHESLFGSDEVDDRAVHPLISHVRVPPLDSSACALLNLTASPAELKMLVQEVCEAGLPGGSEKIEAVHS
jgi:FlaA1/EpsC-like NDP-sugar epimerase